MTTINIIFGCWSLVQDCAADMPGLEIVDETDPIEDTQQIANKFRY